MTRQKTVKVTTKPTYAELKLFVSALTKENLVLQKKIATCEAKCITHQNKIAPLESEIKDLKNSHHRPPPDIDLESLDKL